MCSHASADGTHMRDVSPGGASPGESETTPAPTSTGSRSSSPLSHEPTSLHSFSKNSMGFSEEKHVFIEEAEGADNYDGATDAVDGGNNES